MQKVKKIPQRQCVGCRTKRDKRDLLRIVKTPEGEIVLDATGKKSGRGVYVCPDPECLRKARKSRGLERALETTIPAEVYDGLIPQYYFSPESQYPANGWGPNHILYFPKYEKQGPAFSSSAKYSDYQSFLNLLPYKSAKNQ